MLKISPSLDLLNIIPQRQAQEPRIHQSGIAVAYPLWYPMCVVASACIWISTRTTWLRRSIHINLTARLALQLAHGYSLRVRELAAHRCACIESGQHWVVIDWEYMSDQHKPYRIVKWLTTPDVEEEGDINEGSGCSNDLSQRWDIVLRSRK